MCCHSGNWYFGDYSRSSEILLPWFRDDWRLLRFILCRLYTSVLFASICNIINWKFVQNYHLDQQVLCLNKPCTCFVPYPRTWNWTNSSLCLRRYPWPLLVKNVSVQKKKLKVSQLLKFPVLEFEEKWWQHPYMLNKES